MKINNVIINFYNFFKINFNKLIMFEYIYKRIYIKSQKKVALFGIKFQK